MSYDFSISIEPLRLSAFYDVIKSALNRPSLAHTIIYHSSTVFQVSSPSNVRNLSDVIHAVLDCLHVPVDCIVDK